MSANESMGNFRMCISAELDECCNTLPVPITNPRCPHRCRYVYGYGIDGSDRPSYLIWPRRGHGGHFWLVDPWTGKFFDPAMAEFLAPIGLQCIVFGSAVKGEA